MMAALEAFLVMEGGRPGVRVPLATRATRYVPFALLLASYLAVEYVVNSRSYLITEGHYRLGWHAVTHGLDYLITLSLGAHNLAFQILAVVGVATLLVAGSARVRFFVVWMLMTIVPSTFFVWQNSSRYLYLPAAGFAMLLAEGILAVRRLMASRLSPRAGRIAAGLLTVALAARFSEGIPGVDPPVQTLRDRRAPGESGAARRRRCVCRSRERRRDSRAVSGSRGRSRVMRPGRSRGRSLRC
jgi:hypothetical protein